MIRTSIGDWPRERAITSPDQVALVDDHRQCTYAELGCQVDAVARALAAAGVRRGDRVGYLGCNRIELVEVFFAVCALGAVFVPLNYRLAVQEVALILDDAGVRVLVRDDECADPLPHVSRPDEICSVTMGSGASGDAGLGALIALAGDGPLDPAGDLHDEPCMIQYTSGTTGVPKGVVLTHANVIWNCLNIVIDNDLTRRDVTLVASPLIHTSALNATLLPTFLKSGKSVMLAKFDPAVVLDVIETQRVSFLSGVPAMFQSMLDSERWPVTGLASLRVVVCAGAPAPGSMITQYQRRSVPFVQGYGMTEAAPAVTMMRVDDAIRKAGTSGRACFFTRVRVVDGDGGPVAAGTIGEIQVSGPNVSSGYWRNEAATAAAFTGDRWFRTGDAGMLDADGYLTVVDRFKDMFISGGENVYPAEVERAILAHPAVAECAVVGIPHARWGEVGRAYVVCRNGRSVTLDDLSEMLESRLARYKHPKSVHLVDAMPVNASGKVLKRDLVKRKADDVFELGD